MEFVTTVNLAELKSSIDFSEINLSDPLITLDQGLVALGGRLDVGTLYQAYKNGIFPWPQEGLPLLWFCPEERGILDFSKYHRPRSFIKFYKKHISKYNLTWNKDFSAVISNCQALSRKNQNGTWIIPDLKKAYQNLHQVGLAHSVECWRDDQLVGGLYGVFIDGVFSGESMFHLEDNASKLCLDFLVQELHERQQLKWMDIQMVTPVLKDFGGHYVSRLQYLDLLKQSQKSWSLKNQKLKPRK